MSAKSVQLRRGTAAETAAFTGAMAEVTIDTTNNLIILHDGVTVGGIPVAKLSDMPIDVSDLTDIDGKIAAWIGGASGYQTDNVVPTATISPINGQTAVTYTTNITITFSEVVRLLDDSALSNTNVDSLITLKDTDINGTDIPFGATVNGKVITINPTSDFSAGQTIYVAIGATIEDLSSNAISATTSTFTTTANATSPDDLSSQLLLIGGGGAGGNNIGGGGGGGGVNYDTSKVIPSYGTYSVTVGAAGQPAANNAVASSSGGSTSFVSSVINLVVDGGGGGGSREASPTTIESLGRNGASGGGAGAANSQGSPGTATGIGAGYDGGEDGGVGDNSFGGGGGGAGGSVIMEAGSTGYTGGGNGISTALNQAMQYGQLSVGSYYVSGGGGGGSYLNVSAPAANWGLGGIGGGGSNLSSPDGNYGGGGAGARSSGLGLGGLGGSGVLFLWIAETYSTSQINADFDGTATATSLSMGNVAGTIITFTSSGTWTKTAGTNPNPTPIVPPAPPVPSTNDSDFDKVTLLSHFDGTNLGTNSNFTDSSYTHTITASGDVFQTSFSPFSRPDGEWSVSFDAAESVVVSMPTSFPFSTDTAASDNFTIEAWVFQSTRPTYRQFDYESPAIFAIGDVYLNFGITATGKLMMNSFDASYNRRYLYSTNDVPLATWTHVAAVVSTGAVLKLYINGILEATGTWYGFENGRNGTYDHHIGRAKQNTNTGFDGNISNLRVVNSSAVYNTSGFTPPTSALTAITDTVLLACQSNRFVDNSTSARLLTPYNLNAKISADSPFVATGGYDPAVNGASGYFYNANAAGGNYISSSSSSDFAFGTGDFTVDLWYYLEDNPTWRNLIDQSYNSLGIAIWIDANRELNFFPSASNGSQCTSNANLWNNEWNHVALVRDSGVTRLYANGVSGPTYSDSNDYTSTDGFKVSSDYNAGFAFEGYVSNVRFIKGTAVYTSDFTPPTSPTTAITNTVLLLNMADGGAIDVSDGKLDMQLFGSARTTTSSKFGTTSLDLPSTADYAFIEDGFPTMNGNFTIECWINPTDISAGARNIYDLNRSSDVSAPVLLQSGATVYLRMNSIQIHTGDVLTANTWHHVALVRNNGVYELFVDGVSTGTYTDAGTEINSNLWIGRKWFDSSENYTGFVGYIDEFRISAVARYVENFDVPTAAFLEGTVTQSTSPGGVLFEASNTWIAPAGVTSVSVVCIGGGGFGGDSSGVGGGDSYFMNTSTVKGGGGVTLDENFTNSRAGGSFAGDGGGNGGGWGGGDYPVSGGGAGGYSGDGGRIAGYNGSQDGNDATLGAGADGAGGGGGSGGVGTFGSGSLGGGGGGVGVYGEGTNGSGGSASIYASIGGVGAGGSSGLSGSSTSGGSYGGGSAGGYGQGWAGTGGGLGYRNKISVTPGASYTVVVGTGGTGSGGNNSNGANGAVRIIWGDNRAFPSTNAGPSDALPGGAAET